MSRERRIIGRCGEERAAEFIAAQGYRVIATNFRRKFGELDLVAEEGGEIVFIEVKTRSGKAYGHPLESITAAKRKRIIRAAAAFLQERGLEDRPCRFDAVAVSIDQAGKWQVEVTRAAFVVE